MKKIKAFIEKHNILIAACLVVVVLAVAFIWQKSHPVVPENSETAAVLDLEDETLFADKVATQDYGKSEAFFKNEEQQKVFIDFGKGYYDFTDQLGGWSFGVPLVKLKYYADLNGLTLQTDKPDTFLYAPTYEIYGAGENIDMAARKAWYLLDDDGWYEKVTVTSKQAFDSKANELVANAATELDSEGYPVIDVSLLPYYDGKEYSLGAEIAYDYRDNGIYLKLTK